MKGETTVYVPVVLKENELPDFFVKEIGQILGGVPVEPLTGFLHTREELEKIVKDAFEAGGNRGAWEEAPIGKRPDTKGEYIQSLFNK